MWWLVTISPSGETNPPEPPLLNRTDASMAFFEPGVGQVEVVLLLEQLARRVVEQPHAFVRDRGHRRAPENQNREREVEQSHRRNLWKRIPLCRLNVPSKGVEFQAGLAAQRFKELIAGARRW